MFLVHKSLVIDVTLISPLSRKTNQIERHSFTSLPHARNVPISEHTDIRRDDDGTTLYDTRRFGFRTSFKHAQNVRRCRPHPTTFTTSAKPTHCRQTAFCRQSRHPLRYVCSIGREICIHSTRARASRPNRESGFSGARTLPETSDKLLCATTHPHSPSTARRTYCACEVHSLLFRYSRKKI